MDNMSDNDHFPNEFLDADNTGVEPTQDIENSINAILEYLWDDELADYKQDDYDPGESEEHMFVHLVRIKAWMERRASNS